MALKDIYDKSPLIIQHLLTTIKGYQLKRRRYNNFYYKKIRYYKDVKDPYKEQDKQVKKLLLQLKYNVPFYKDYLKDIPNSELSVDVLLDLPLIEKENLRNNIKNHININKSNISVVKTGGTTGKSLNVYSSKEDSAKRMAYLDYFKQKHGVEPFSKRASFTGQEIIPYKQTKRVYWRYNHAIRQMLYSGFHVNDKNIPYYIKSLNQYKPKMIDGFPTSIYSIARYINLNNIKLAFTPNCIFPTAETLLDHHREEIEKAFKCPIRNQYASSEGAPFITECIKGKLHMNIETGYFNLKTYNVEKNLYELIVTSFLNYTTPIVQYRIGDIVEYIEDQPKCSCGNKSPFVKRILGRQTDYLVSKENGRITSANLSNVIKNAPNSIISCQFVQKAIDKIIINIVVDKTRYENSDSTKIVDAIKYRFGKNTQVKFNYIEEIEKEASGKTLFLKNLLNK